MRINNWRGKHYAVERAKDAIKIYCDGKLTMISDLPPTIKNWRKEVEEFKKLDKQVGKE